MYKREIGAASLVVILIFVTFFTRLGDPIATRISVNYRYLVWHREIYDESILSFQSVLGEIHEIGTERERGNIPRFTKDLEGIARDKRTYTAGSFFEYMVRRYALKDSDMESMIKSRGSWVPP